MIDVLVPAGVILFIIVMVGWGIPAGVRFYRVRRFQQAIIREYGPKLDQYREYVQAQLFDNDSMRDTVAELGNGAIDKFAKDLAAIDLDPVEENEPEENRGN